ncbi:MAG: 1-acyl-sn-glycerol-3-phosphate acyltransferase [Proteobacteria bacterium]|nr:1-acyl-sn-glycerol-3-phosphate acyltransferase [Pseudomonadota bacterium]
MRVLLGIIRILSLALMAAMVLIIHGLGRLIGRHWSFPTSVCFLVARLFGFTPRVVGTQIRDKDRPVFFASNHVSYLDIVILGSQLDALFVAKSEVANWPLFGVMAKIQNTVFIRRAKTAIDSARDTLASLLRQKKSVIVFAEGTSTDGASVKPFKPGLFDALYEPGVDAVVQPVAIVLESIEGQRIGGNALLRDRYAWWRPEHTLVPHLWAFACTKRAGVSLHFLHALNPKDFEDRKELAAAAHKAIQAVVEAESGLR